MTTLLSFNLDNISTFPERLNALLKTQQSSIDDLFAKNPKPTYHTLISLLESLDNELHLFWSPISHLNAVKNSEALRDAYEKCLPILSEHHTWLSHHQKLSAAFEYIAATPEFKKLSAAEQKYVKDSIRDFKLAGVALPPDQKKEFAELTSRLSEISNQFEQHLMDASDAWTLHITETIELSGIPESSLAMFKEFAQEKKQTGYLLNLHAPCFQAVITYADNRALREKIYLAWITRASDIGPHGGKFDNTSVMIEILKLKYRLAKLLGFQSYAEYALVTKMAKTPKAVNAFLENLISLAKPFAEKEFEALRTFAKSLGLEKLEPWDIAYVSEKLKQEQLHFDDEALRPYFPLPVVLEGLFKVATKLFNIHFKPAHLDSWHPDVSSYEVLDEQGHTIAYFYLDLYARSKKRGGAWMDDAAPYWQATQQKPITFLTCNFAPPLKDQPALLTHDEVVTLFHEFGHGLHHMLTQVSVLGLTGTHVEWDAVELPSQFMENWCWDAECLAFMSQHYQNHNPIPPELLQQLLNSKNFLSGMFLVRQLEFALFDLRLHWQFDPNKGVEQIQTILDQVRKEVSVIPITTSNRFQHSFSHIFAGGYASGYYSYLWAEVLAADAFSLFEEHGGLSHEIGKRFKDHILAKGGAEDAAVLFKRFRGRDPELSALLKSYGLETSSL